MHEKLSRGPDSGRFLFQNWPVYEASIEFVKLAYELCESLPRDSATGLRDQLRRAAQSVPLNIAEGCARYSTKDKSIFFSGR